MPVPHHYSHVEGWKVLLEGLQIANDMAEVTFPVDLFRSLKDNLMEVLLRWSLWAPG